MILTYELDLDTVKMNEHTTHPDERWFHSKLLSAQTNRTHTPDRLLYLYQYS